MTRTSEIFHVSESAEKVICPPDLVFRNQDFEFLLAEGGHLVEDDAQYYDFMKLLKEIGETGFTIKENLGATLTDRTTPLKATFSVNSNLKEFYDKMWELDEHMPSAMTTLHWFIHGESKGWGLYMAEFPTINIIGCKSGLTEKFRRVFKIEGSGYEQEKELLNGELKLLKDLDGIAKFCENYKIKTHHKST